MAEHAPSDERRAPKKRISKKLGPMSFRLDPDVRSDLEKFSEASARSMSNYVNWVLREHFAALKKQQQ